MPIIEGSVERGAVLTSPGRELYVDATNGSNSNGGTNWAGAFLTMTYALTQVADNDTVYVKGSIREQCTAPLGIQGVSIIGAVGGRPRHDDGARWYAPASPTAATGLLRLREQGWRVENILFAPHTDAAAIELRRAEDATYPDASHAIIRNNVFTGGALGIEDIGGIHHCLIEDNEFRLIVETGGTGGVAAAIKTRSTGIAVPLRNIIRGNLFMENTNDVCISSSYGLIEGNRFFTKSSMNLSTVYVSAQGGYNIVTGNVFPDNVADIDPGNGYDGAATDTWTGNLVANQAAFHYGDPA